MVFRDHFPHFIQSQYAVIDFYRYGFLTLSPSAGGEKSVGAIW